MPYQSGIAGAGIELLRLPINGGPSAARNHGVRHIEAEWLIFLDDDDRLEPFLMGWISEHTGPCLDQLDLVHFGFRTLNQEGNIASAVVLSTNAEPSVLSGSWMIRREFFMRIGGYEERLRYSENSDLIDRAILAGARTLHAGFSSLSYTVGRLHRREEMASRRARACLFHLRHRPQCQRVKMLKIGLINSWWNRNPLLAAALVLAYISKTLQFHK